MSLSELDHGSEGAGPPTLVFLHAGVSDARMWTPLIGELTPSCRAIWLDLRGFGRTPSTTADFSHGDDLVSLVRNQADGPVWLVGASIGARVAVDVVLAGELDVEGLVLAPPTVSGMSFDDDVAASWDAIDAYLEAGRIDDAVAEELRVWVVGPDRTHDDVDPEVLSLARDMIRTNSTHVDHDTEVRSELKAATALEQIEVPALLVVGAGDRHEVRELAADMEARSGQSELHVIADAAHLVALERPAIVANLIRDFLGRHGWWTAAR